MCVRHGIHGYYLVTPSYHKLSWSYKYEGGDRYSLSALSPPREARSSAGCALVAGRFLVSAGGTAMGPEGTTAVLDTAEALDLEKSRAAASGSAWMALRPLARARFGFLLVPSGIDSGVAAVGGWPPVVSSDKAGLAVELLGEIDPGVEWKKEFSCACKS